MMKLIAAGTLALVLCAHAPVLAQTAPPPPKQSFTITLLPLPGVHIAAVGALPTDAATTPSGTSIPGPLAPVPGTQTPASRAVITIPDTLPTALIPTMVPTREGAPPAVPKKSGIRRP